MTHLLVQQLIIGDGNDQNIISGPLDPSIATIGDLLNILTSFLFPIAGVLLFLFLAWGGFDFLLSQGDKEKVGKGKAKITAAAVGFILLVSSYIIVRLVIKVLGLNSAESLF